MRILVTGRDGQVARSLAECPASHELIFTARPHFDLADPASIERAVAAIAPDLIVSAAAYTAVDRAESEPELALQINGEGPGVLAQAAARIGAPVIQLSTDYVFDGSLDRPYREGDPVDPVNTYGATKLAGERAIAASGARSVILRTAWIYSAHGANFVRTMLRLAGERDELRVVDDQIGCPTSAADIAAAILHVGEALKSNDGAEIAPVYHLAGTGETSWAGFARAIFAESRRGGGARAEVVPIATADYPTPARRPANSRLDTGAFAARFGYRLPAWRDSMPIVIERLGVTAAAPAGRT